MERHASHFLIEVAFLFNAMLRKKEKMTNYALYYEIDKYLMGYFLVIWDVCLLVNLRNFLTL